MAATHAQTGSSGPTRTNTHIRRAPQHRVLGGVARSPGATAQHLQRTIGNQATQALLQRIIRPAASRPAKAIQAKLTVGPPDDMYEREAEAAANRLVVGEPVQQISRLPAGGLPQRAREQEEDETARFQPAQRQEAEEDYEPNTALQRQEEEEEEQGPVQARVRAADTGIDTATAERAMARTGSGSPLPSAVQAQMEEGIGADFSGVRVHTGSAADEANRALDARAFTRGSDVYLARGESQTDRRLMAHELTHVVQQEPSNSARAGRDAGSEVDRAAGAGARETLLQRFIGTEHEDLGNVGSSKALTDIEIGPGQFLTYGEVVALAGDYFADPGQMRTLSQTHSGTQQLIWARWKALGSSGTEPAVPQDIKKAVMDRYYELAAANVRHFSAGGTAGSTYREYHERALKEAFNAGRWGASAGFSQAQTTEAFGHHFLTDMFAAGHVRTPRSDIRSWYQSKYPTSIDQLVAHMAKIMHTFLVREHPYLDFFGRIPSEGEIADTIRDIGGPALRAFSLGDIVSLAFHNADNIGLDVVSDVNPAGVPVPGGYPWMAVGDTYLSTPAGKQTLDMAIAAVRASLDDLTRAQSRGAASRGPYAPSFLDQEFQTLISSLQINGKYRAEEFIPREDPGSSKNSPMSWHWGSFNSAMRIAVDTALMTEVAKELREKSKEKRAQGGKKNEFAADALDDFVDNHLSKGQTKVLEDAIGAPAGAGSP